MTLLKSRHTNVLIISRQLDLLIPNLDDTNFGTLEHFELGGGYRGKYTYFVHLPPL